MEDLIVGDGVTMGRTFFFFFDADEGVGKGVAGVERFFFVLVPRGFGESMVDGKAGFSINFTSFHVSMFSWLGALVVSGAPCDLRIQT